MTVHRTPATDRPSAPQGNLCSISHFLVSLRTQVHPNIAHPCCDQLKAVKKGIRWPVSPDRMAGSGIDRSRPSIFWSYPLTRYSFINDCRLKFIFFFKCIGNKLCSWAALLQFWFQTDLGRENSASYYRQGRQLLLTFITIVTRWSHSTSNLYALIGQNLTSEFMAKMYAASGNLFTDNCYALPVFAIFQDELEARISLKSFFLQPKL